MPSLKGADSILNGIAAISEYKIFVNPNCVNMIRELSTYIYDDRTNERGQKLPRDCDNHLCDALRYAFCDVKHFHPTKEKNADYSISPIAENLNKGWDI